MYLEYSYKNNGLNPILVLEEEDDCEAFKAINDISFLEYSYKEKDGLFHIRIALKYSEGLALTPDVFLRVLNKWQAYRLITFETVMQLSFEYGQQYRELPYLLKEADDFTIDPPTEKILYPEIIHLNTLIRKLFLKNELTSKIGVNVRYWLNLFYRDTKEKEEHIAIQKMSMSNSNINNLKNIIICQDENNKADLMIPTDLKEGNYSIAKLIFINFFHIKGVKPKDIDQDEHFMNQVCKNPRSLQIFLPAAFWAVFGIDTNQWDTTEQSKKFQFLKIIVGEKHAALKEYFGFYDQNDSIYLSDDDDVLIHELIHAILQLLYNNKSNPIKKNASEQAIWEEVTLNFLNDLVYNEENFILPRELSFSNYPSKDQIPELAACWLHFKLLYPHQKTPISKPIQDFIEKTFDRIAADADIWCEEFIIENGLCILDAFKNSDWRTGILNFSKDDCNIINNARKNKISVLEAKITLMLENLTPSEIIQELSLKNITWHSMLISTVRLGHINLLQELLKNTQLTPNKLLNKAFFWGAYFKRKEIVELLLAQGLQPMLDVNTVNVLHLAAYGGWENIVEQLLNFIPVDAVDKNGLTPLHCAIFNNEHKVISLLLNKGASIAAKTAGGMTVLHLAVMHGDISLIGFLLNLKTDINSLDNSGDTPLHVALENDSGEHNLKIVKYLLQQKNININQRNHAGHTPLFVAVLNRNLDSVRLLCEDRRINPNVFGLSGLTPLLLSLASDQIECAKCILKAKFGVNLDINYADPAMKQTALHIACEKGQKEIVQLLLSKPEIKTDLTDLNEETADQLSNNSEIKNLFVNNKIKNPKNHSVFWEASSPKNLEVEFGNVDSYSEEMGSNVKMQ